MEGEIGVRSQPGHGATFWFTAQFEKQTGEAEARHASARDRLNMRVLVVDDNRTNRQILRNQLVTWKMQVSSAAGGAEALDLLRVAAGEGLPYDLALLDVQMPEMDGFALAAAIKGDPSLAATRLIVLTSVGQAPRSAELTRLGIESFLIKPVKQSRLFDCLIGRAGRGVETDKPESHRAGDGVTSPKSPQSEPEFYESRILLAEDNFINQTVALAQLHRLHYRADAVANGREVLEVLERIPYELILLDCQMPEMDGYEVARWIRQQENRLDSPCQWKSPLRLIALTAHAMQGEREKCLAVGMDDYLTKPLQPADLQAALERWQIALQKVGKASRLTQA
jgi:CheY-like chemotaxis protein